MHFLLVLVEAALLSFGFLLLLGVLLSYIGGWAIFCRAPLLDVIVSAFTWVPWVLGGMGGGKWGIIGAIIGQICTLYAWCSLHEMMHPRVRNGPGINSYIDRLVGRWRNHLALWVTSVAIPGFWAIRLMEFVAYPPLVWLLKFPKYRQSEWVMVSRQKFGGLVGQDLVWCLYCDWMTGVYSLGAEMLRNVESFWCPIKFYDGKKCDNCKMDFPDIENGWIPPGGTMTQVESLLKEKYGDGHREWFGHPARLTVKGEPLAQNSEPRSNEATKEDAKR